MKIDYMTGSLIICGIILLLLARIIILFRIKSKRAELVEGKSRRALKKAIANGKIPIAASDHRFHLVGWYLILIAILIILFGILLRFTDWPIRGWILEDWWWIFISAGVAIAGLSVR